DAERPAVPVRAEVGMEALRDADARDERVGVGVDLRLVDGRVPRVGVGEEAPPVEVGAGAQVGHARGGRGRRGKGTAAASGAAAARVDSPAAAPAAAGDEGEEAGEGREATEEGTTPHGANSATPEGQPTPAMGGRLPRPCAGPPLARRGAYDGCRWARSRLHEVTMRAICLRLVVAGLLAAPEARADLPPPESKSKPPVAAVAAGGAGVAAIIAGAV